MGTQVGTEAEPYWGTDGRPENWRFGWGIEYPPHRRDWSPRVLPKVRTRLHRCLREARTRINSGFDLSCGDSPLWWVGRTMTDPLWERMHNIGPWWPGRDDPEFPERGLLCFEDFATEGSFLDEIYLGWHPLGAVAWRWFARQERLETLHFLRYTDVLHAPRPWSEAGLVLLQGSDLREEDDYWSLRLLGALWRLSQEKITSVTRLSEQRQAEGTAPRRARPADDVRIISLRETLRPLHEHQEPLTHWDYRVIRGEHYRTYWTGPGRAVPKKILILEHEAGPKDKPLRPRRDTVKAVRR